jgi:hypothetical protein
VSVWKQAWTKTFFVISKLALEFHNSLIIAQVCDIMSCSWSFVFCIQLSRQEGVARGFISWQVHNTIFFTKSICNFVIVAELVHFFKVEIVTSLLSVVPEADAKQLVAAPIKAKWKFVNIN